MCNSASLRQRGFSLIEVVVLIVILGIAFTGILMLYNRLTTASVDPLVRKQALAIAGSLLDEIQLRSFTYCDPDDANVYTATSAIVGAGGCVALATVEGIGPEGETRSGSPGFDNVSDYNGFAMGSGQPSPNDSIKTVNGSMIAALGDYAVSASVAVIADGELPGFGGAGSPVADALRVTVTATHVLSGTTVSLQGYRTRYAPNAP